MFHTRLMPTPPIPDFGHIESCHLCWPIMDKCPEWMDYFSFNYNCWILINDIFCVCRHQCGVSVLTSLSESNGKHHLMSSRTASFTWSALAPFQSGQWSGSPACSGLIHWNTAQGFLELLHHICIFCTSGNICMVLKLTWSEVSHYENASGVTNCGSTLHHVCWYGRPIAAAIRESRLPDYKPSLPYT